MYLSVDVANLVNYFTKNNKNLIKIENFVNFLLRYCLFWRPNHLFLATQVISLKSVCRGHKCAIMPVFMFATHGFMTKSVCRGQKTKKNPGSFV